jgi:fumarate reductase subunit D
VWGGVGVGVVVVGVVVVVVWWCSTNVVRHAHRKAQFQIGLGNWTWSGMRLITTIFAKCGEILHLRKLW